jgi:ribosomal protein S18 acetylase RimI-like enzyme
VSVELVRVSVVELDEFVAQFDEYRHELDPYNSLVPDTLPIERYAEALRSDPSGQELLWVEADGKRAGFLLIRCFEDWPDPKRIIIDIAECYVIPAYRRRGVGRAAIAALLERERARGTALIEASVLRANADALAFWESLGFAQHSIRTARQP